MKVSQNPETDGVLETLQQFAGEGGGFEEAEAGFGIGRILSRLTLYLLEEPVHDDEMVVKMRVQRRAEAMQETDSPERGVRWSRGTGLPEGGPESPEQDVEDGAGGAGPVMEEGPEAFGHREDPLAHGHVGKTVVHQVSRGLGHALGVA